MERSDTRKTRRGLLSAAAAAAAAVAASKALAPESASAIDGNPIIIGGTRIGSHSTSLWSEVDDHGFVGWNDHTSNGTTGISAFIGAGADIPGFQGSGDLPNPSLPAALFAFNAVGGGAAVFAQATKQFGKGVYALGTEFNTTAVYAEATAGSSAAIEAKNVSGPAILSTGEHYGLQAGALNPFGIGVQAYGPAKGVEGLSSASGGIGVAARSDDGTALQVLGPNAFSQAGTGTIPAGKRSAPITGLKVKAGSGVLVTLNTAPPAGVRVDFARVVPPGKVVVILNQKTTKPITFTYFVLEKATP